MHLRTHGPLLAAALALAASPARAQQPQGPRDRQTRSLIANAMEDYQNLEMDRAAERLQVALRGCANDTCSPQVEARLHMSIGVVAVGGQQDNGAGVEAMVRALRLDPNAEPDALLVTPEIAAAFRLARARAARQAPAREAVESPPAPAPTPPESAPPVARTEPAPRAPSGRYARFSVDVGGGVGLAYIAGFINSLPDVRRYAEYREWNYVYTDASGRSVTVPQRTLNQYCTDGTYCAIQVDAGMAPTFFLSTLVRVNLSRRVGIGLGLRYQFDAAPWTIPPPDPRPATQPNPPYVSPTTTTKNNPFANLLINARIYYAFTPDGFAPEGFVASAFVGGGGGQIEPKPALPSTVTQSSAHFLSGYGNLVVGARVEHGLRSGFHVGAEVAVQFMFPTFLFNIDVTPFVGFHL